MPIQLIIEITTGVIEGAAFIGAALALASVARVVINLFRS